MDENGSPTVVAGVPPDYFSATGQRWGNPLYDWAKHQETDFAWWKARMRKTLSMVDIVRIDHFRAFAAYWEIPGHEETAINGKWVEAPGDALFFHANLLHRSDQNRSESDRWALVCCYNARSNDPYRDGRHPRYTPLARVSGDAIRKAPN